MAGLGSAVIFLGGIKVSPFIWNFILLYAQKSGIVIHELCVEGGLVATLKAMLDTC